MFIGSGELKGRGGLFGKWICVYSNGCFFDLFVGVLMFVLDVGFLKIDVVGFLDIF